MQTVDDNLENIITIQRINFLSNWNFQFPMHLKISNILTEIIQFGFIKNKTTPPPINTLAVQDSISTSSPSSSFSFLRFFGLSSLLSSFNSFFFSFFIFSTRSISRYYKTYLTFQHRFLLL